MSQTEQWLNDIPLHSTRPMDEAEQLALRAENRATRLSILGICAAIAVGWIVLLIVWMNITNITQPSANNLGLVGDILLLATIVVGYRSRTRLRLVKQIVGDVAGATVLQFKTESEEQWRKLAPYLKTALNGRYFASDEPHTIEVLPSSGRLHALDGSRIRAKVLAPLRETAPVPTFAALAAQWLQPVEGHATDVSTGGRDLSGDEHDEIDSYASGTWKRPLLWTSGVTVWAILVMSDMMHERLPLFAALSICTIIGYPLVTTWQRLIRALLISYRLRQDVAADRVIIVGMRTEDTPKSAAGIPQRIIEILPKSHLVWTESGRPAPWRRMLPTSSSVSRS